MNNDRRLRRVLVSERLLVEMFQGPGQCVCLRLDHPRLPPDAKVVGVWADYSRQALVALVRSNSFDIVSPGREIPLFDEDASFANVEYAHVVGDRIVTQKRTHFGTWSPAMAFRMPELSPEAAAKLAQAAIQMQLANADAALKRPIENEVCQPPVATIPVVDDARRIVGTAENVRPAPDGNGVLCDVTLDKPIPVSQQGFTDSNELEEELSESPGDWFRRIMGQSAE